MKRRYLVLLFIVASSLVIYDNAFCQDKIKGRIIDEDGQGLAGANIYEKANPSNGTVTDVNGYFTLKVEAGTVLVMSFIGFENKEFTVPKEDNFTIMISTDIKKLKVFWCCTSHDIPHCNSNMKVLKETHDKEEIYKIKRSR